MRQKVNVEALKKFMEVIGRSGRKNARIYFVGGATAVLLGWRDTTIDIDLKLVPEVNEVLKSLPQLKEQLQINIELASPDDFIPALPGWELLLMLWGGGGAEALDDAVAEDAGVAFDGGFVES